MMQMTTTSNNQLPVWMLAPEDQGKSNKQLAQESQDARFSVFFETVLHKLEHGALLTDIIRDDQRGYSYDGLLRWIMKDPQRKARYYEAQEIGTEIIVDEAVKIADGADGMEDVQRSKLRIDTRLWAVKARNRKRFGEVKTLEVNQNISITAALEQANARLPGRVIDIEDVE
jgi:hypothetical protein